MKPFFYQLLLICLLASAQVHGAVSCRAIFARLGVKESKNAILNQNEKQLLRASFWLSRNAKKIDPKKTHLPQLAPLIDSYLTVLENQLNLKSDEPLYSERVPQIKKILAEGRSRIRDGGLTYEYIFSLPFRLSILLNMRDSIENQPSYWGLGDKRFPEISKNPALLIENYLAHDKFVEMLEYTWKNYSLKRNSQFNDNQATEYSFWVHVYHALSNFNKAQFLPFFGDLTIAVMNEMTDHGVWPIGSFLKPVRLDGIQYDERGATLHDLLHATSYLFDSTDRQHYFYPPVRFEDLNMVKKVIYQNIKSSKATEDHKWLLHFFQHILFHEVQRDAFEMDPDSVRTREGEINSSAVVIQKLYLEVENEFKSGRDLQNTRERRFYRHLQIEVEERFPNEIERKKLVEQALAEYSGFIKQALDYYLKNVDRNTIP